MLKFKQFINEEVDGTIDTDATRLSNNLETFNDELDTLTSKPYQNAPVFLAQLRGVCERYGVQIPQSATPEFLNLGAELVYSLGESDQHLYIVYDTNDADGFVDGYAQVVTNEELKDLMGMTGEELAADREKITFRPSTWYKSREDDGGNSDEY